jgi:hypothetical protein
VGPETSANESVSPPEVNYSPFQSGIVYPITTRAPEPRWNMRRREFLGALGATAAWPLGARAERADKVYRIGYLGLASAAAQDLRRGVDQSQRYG